MTMTAAEREKFEQQVLALIAGEMNRLADRMDLYDYRSRSADILRDTFPVPTAPPPAAESEEEVVERVAEAIKADYFSAGHTGWDSYARAAIAAVKGGGGE